MKEIYYEIAFIFLIFLSVYSFSLYSEDIIVYETKARMIIAIAKVCAIIVISALILFAISKIIL